MGHKAGVLIGGLRVGAFCRDVVDRLAVLALVASDHVDWLLDEVEIEVLVAKRGCEVKVSVNEGLRAGIEEGIYVRLVPSRLFDWLEFAVEIIQPLSDVSLIGFECVIPRGIIETQVMPLYG